MIYGINLIEIGIFIAFTAGAFYAIRYPNFHQTCRYRQWLTPILALVWVSISIYYYFKDYDDKLIDFLKDYLFANGITLPKLAAINVELIYGLAVVYAFGIIKFIVHHFIYKRKKYTSNYLPKLPDPERKSKPEFAYRVNSAQYIVLQQAWDFVKRFFEIMMLVAAAFYLMSIFFAAKDWEFPTALFILPTFLFLEVFWFLGGKEDQSTSLEDQFTGFGPSIKKRISFSNLWEEYQQVWGGDKLLLAWHYDEPIQFDQVQKIEEHTDKDAIELIKKGYELSERQYQILESIQSRKDVIVSNPRYEELAPTLFTGLLRKLLNGKHILILTPKIYFSKSDYHSAVVKWVKKWLTQISGNDTFWNVQTYDRTIRGDLNGKIVVSCAEEILEHNAARYPWFDNLQTVVFLYGTESFAEAPTSNNILLNILRDKNPDIQSIVLTDHRRELQASIKRNLDIKMDIRETRILANEPNGTYLLFWAQEAGRFYQNQILQGDIDAFLGVNPVLSLTAWRENIEHIELVQHEQLPWFEYLEEIKNNKDRLIPEIIHPANLQGDIHQQIDCREYSIFNQKDDAAFMLAHDSEYNLITCLEKWNAYGKEMTFLHVVSPPYLLRNYFVDNIKYFKKAPIYAFTSYLMTSRFSIAMSLLERMTNMELTEAQIAYAFSQAEIKSDTIKAGIESLFELAFGINLSNNEFLQKRLAYEYQKMSNEFEEIYYYTLNSSIKDQIELAFLKPIKIGEQYQGNIHKVISYDLLYQNYLPTQLHAFHGRMFEIESFDEKGRFLRTNNINPKNIIQYRSDLEVMINHIPEPIPAAHKNAPQEGLNLALCEGDFSIKTKGYFSFKTGIHLQNINRDFEYIAMPEQRVPDRRYRLGRVLKINIQSPIDIPIQETAATLSTLIKEVFYTLFPDSHQYLVVCSPQRETVLKGRFKQLYTSIQLEEANTEAGIQLYIFEDAHQDLGLVNRIYKDWKSIFSVIEDYISWIRTKKTQQKTASNKEKNDGYTALHQSHFRAQALDPSQFLKYGFKDYPSHLDLKSTALLLRSILGSNNLTSEREDFLTGKKQQRYQVVGGEGAHQCDFCGKNYHESQLEVFEDGRERCQSCKATGIDSMPALIQLYEEAKRYFEGFDIQLRNGISVNFHDTAAIQIKNGGLFTPTPAFDPRAIGLAVRKKNAYSIWIENGQAKHKTISTIVHELTHIWQYTHLDMALMKKHYGNMLIEGHTTWTEVDFMRKNNLPKQYIKQLIEQDNEYGKGYHLVLELLLQHPAYNGNPFKYLLDKYPI